MSNDLPSASDAVYGGGQGNAAAPIGSALAAAATPDRVLLDVFGAPLQFAPAAAPAKKKASASTSAGSASPSIVREAQGALNTLGYGPLAVDGAPGPATAAAAKRFQVAKGLTVDGKIGPLTIAALRAAAAAPPSPSAPATPATPSPAFAQPSAPVSPNAATPMANALASSSSSSSSMKWYAGGAALLALVGLGAAASRG